METISSISVTPTNPSVPINSVEQYIATAIYGDSSKQVLGNGVTWTSSNTSVATISSTGLLSAVSQGQTTVQAAFGSFNGSTSLTVGNSVFVPVGNMVTARWGHTATLLPNGKVLIVGGYDSSGHYLASAELYDPATQTFSATGSLATGRADHTATLLPDGTVLVTGGLIETQNYTFESLSDAQIYNPATGTFSFASEMNEGHYNHTATLLENGKVLIAGGNYFAFGGGSMPADSELYDPSTHTFTVTGSMVTPRENHTATVLNDGTVLIVGGDISESGSVPPAAEIYDPTTGTFTGTGNLNVASEYDTATLLPSGQVLVAGGYCPSCTQYVLARTELYDPVAKTFALSTNLAVAREDQTATLLNNGTALVVGGLTASNYTGTAEVFDPSSQTFTGAGSLQSPRDGHTATLLNDGTVLIVGGETVGGLANAELYAPTPPAPFSIQVTPGTASISVGGTQQFTAVSNIGYPRTDATWSVSDSSLASITNDSSPVLTALAAGQVTITATVDNVSAQAQVTISPSGTIPPPGAALWTLPPVPGFLPAQLAQAVPSDGGPGMFSIQSSTDGTQSIVQALTSDGQQLWQAQLPVLNGNSVPDANGGLLVVENQTCKQGQTEPMTITDLDPSTGQPVWQYPAQSVAGSYCYPDAPQMAIRPDGSVVIVAPGNTSGLPEVFIVSGQSGEVEVAPYVPPSSYEDNLGDYIGGYSPIGAPIVDSDGTTYVEYEVRQIAYPPKVTSAILYLMEVTSAGAITSTELSSTTEDENLFPGRIIPDGQGGVLATWAISPGTAPMPTNPYQAAYVVSGAITASYSLPFTPQHLVFGVDGLPINPSLALGASGIAFATDGQSTGDSTNPSLGPKVVSFNLASGSVNWSYQVGTQSTLSIMAVATDGSLSINDSQAGVVQLDTNGNGSQITGPLGAVPQYSWGADWQIQGPQGSSELALSLDVDPGGVWATPNGGPSQNGGAIALCPCVLQSSGGGTDSIQRQLATHESPSIANSGTPSPANLARGAAAPLAGAPADCPICGLTSPSCLPPMAGAQSTYLLIVGDQGRNNGPGHNWNVGYEFGLAAQQAANDLQTQGHRVIACRASGVQDFNNELTGNGLVDGGVIYFGHAGKMIIDGTTYRALFVGQDPVVNENLYSGNVMMLSNTQLGSGVSVTLNGCDAGADIVASDSIALLMSARLQVLVWAYNVGLYFSPLDADHETMWVRSAAPSDLPVYMVPVGPPGRKPKPILFQSH
ncbi:MAG: kelch repeat-containing protein [Candidatus Binataceae bacterium]